MAGSRKRWVAATVLIFIVGIGVSVGIVRSRRGKVLVQVDKVGRQDLVSIVSASGEVKPKRYVNVSANVSGRITRLLVKEGDRVHKGQVLATIDSTRFEADTRQSVAAVEAARSDLDRSLADLEASRLNFDRTTKMHADKLVSDQVMEQAQADFKVKQAVVESTRKRINQLEAALASNQDILEKATIPAPMDGVVTNLPLEEGESVIGAQSFQPTVIMTVADLSVMEAEVMVDETDIRNVKLGQPAEVRVDAFEGVKIRGEVTEIGSSAIPRGTSGVAQAAAASANTGNQAKDFKVTITLKDPPGNLRPGLNAAADVTTDQRKNVVAVPIQAVVVRPVDKTGRVVDPEAVEGAGPPTSLEARPKGEEKDGVFVVEAGAAHFRAVKTGIIGETDIEITSGLTEGQQIVTGSYKTLRTLKDASRIRTEDKAKERS